MNAQPQSIVEAFLAAQAAFDFERARTYLADRGFSYVSPIARFTRADDYIQYATLSSAIIYDREVRKVFVDDADVCHFMTYRIQISEKMTVDLVQWAHVQDGRICRIEILFDASSYREMFRSEPTGSLPF